jgi:hypothetical protein
MHKLVNFGELRAAGHAFWSTGTIPVFIGRRKKIKGKCAYGANFSTEFQPNGRKKFPILFLKHVLLLY